MSVTDDLKRTPLFDTHVSVGGKMVPFGGWEMPIQYGSILDESRAVRSKAGLFDVSHMGRVTIEGPDAEGFLSSVLSVDVSRIRLGRARYNVICNEEGGIIDDCIVYRRAEERYLLIPNASNTPPVLEWLDRWLSSGGDVAIENVTPRYAMIAVQGPEAVAMVSELASEELSSLRPFATRDVVVGGHETMVARTGYTGEDGVELILPSEAAAEVWSKLMDAGAVACGLGARDVLRLEAGLLLHGNDMDVSINPYEAGLDRFVNPDREGYVARESLLKIRDQEIPRRLVGFNMVGRGIARHGHKIMDGATKLGEVTSGSHSPTLDRSIGLGYVPTEYSAVGTRFEIDVRGRIVEAEVTNLPFYSRSKN